MNQKILLVDDDPNILQGYKRQLRKKFTITIANGGQEGLEAIAKNGPFAVIVSDMQMPEMDGAQFLGTTAQRAPDSVRIMLTGNADQKTAVDAVNDANVFRFLSKPCTPEAMAEALTAGIEQYRLITAERELLSKTLSGSVSVLTEVLSLANPTAFGYTTRVRRMVRQFCTKMKVPNTWEIEIAAMLSQIGCVTIAESTLRKIDQGEELTPEELQYFQEHPQVGSSLIAKIPRLKGVAEIIAYQQKCYDGSGSPADEKSEAKIPQGARILKLSTDVVRLLSKHHSAETALSLIRDQAKLYDPDLLEILPSVLDIEYIVKQVKVLQLEEGMVLDENIMSNQGDVLLANGQEVTSSMRERLLRFLGTTKGVKEPIRVRQIAHKSENHQEETNQPQEEAAAV